MWKKALWRYSDGSDIDKVKTEEIKGFLRGFSYDDKKLFSLY